MSPSNFSSRWSVTKSRGKPGVDPVHASLAAVVQILSVREPPVRSAARYQIHAYTRKTYSRVLDVLADGSQTFPL